MKKIFFLIGIFTTIAGYSQDAFDAMAKESCSCVEAKKIDFSKDSNLKDIQIGAGMCIIETYAKHKTKLTASEQKEFEGSEGMRRLGEKVAMKMINYCPDVIMAMGRKYLDEKGGDEVIEEAPEMATVTGKVAAIETKQFVTFKVKDRNNRVHNLLLLDYFETASLFVDGEIKVGTELTIGYSEIELYDPIAKDFKYYKIITNFEKK